MMRGLLIAGLILIAGLPAAAQQGASSAPGASMRLMDKISGDVIDFDLRNNESRNFDRLTVHLQECRYPTGNPSGEAFAFLSISSGQDAAPVFEGWMIASSPALNAMDHARYDVWVLRCITP